MKLVLEVQKLEAEKVVHYDEEQRRMVEFPGKNIYVLQCCQCKDIRITNRNPK
jgi:hypothetical protein